MSTNTITQRELFPSGRQIYYEGDNPEGFALEIKERFGFDPRISSGWDEEHGYSFVCPAEFLDAIYGSELYPMGS
jgi:hypothetical protein